MNYGKQRHNVANRTTVATETAISDRMKID
jgi:hypothetical protein